MSEKTRKPLTRKNYRFQPKTIRNLNLLTITLNEYRGDKPLITETAAVEFAINNTFNLLEQNINAFIEKDKETSIQSSSD